jgi:pimeloyl-ACP methyl ester carboxylesterase
MRVRECGESGPLVIVLHGGPGAPGYMAPVARGLEDRFRVLEPLQRGSGPEPLTVATHVEDLHELILSRRRPGERPALVGSSWGAMLALAYAAAHPADAGPLVLVGCGTFDTTARGRMREILDERMDAEFKAEIERIESEIEDPDERLEAVGRHLLPIYSVDPAFDEREGEPCDDRAHRETWDDMIRCQEEGLYPAAFAAIESPVLMLHGAFDPHPGRMIRDGLRPLLPDLEYVEWERCGHYPWTERHARDDFFRVLRAWLVRSSHEGARF